MSDQPVLLQVPEALYERIRQLAEDSQRPVENLLLDSLNLLFGSFPEETAIPLQIETLSDEALWALVFRPLAWPQEARLDELMALSKINSLSAADQHELEALVARVDRFVYIRSQALLQLKARGHDVERRLRLGN